MSDNEDASQTPPPTPTPSKAFDPQEGADSLRQNGTMPPFPPPTPTMPPTVRASAPYAPSRSTWPTVLGVIAIVFGALGMLKGIWGLLTPLFLDAMADMMPSESAASFEVMEEWASYFTAMYTATILVGGVLLAAGIGLIKRRPWGVTAVWLWVFVRMVLAVGEAVLSSRAQHEQFTAMTRQDPTLQGMGSGFASQMAIFSFAITLLWGWALPVFMLIWFLRKTIKAEVAQWS
jgi:hypothetical protein